MNNKKIKFFSLGLIVLLAIMGFVISLSPEQEISQLEQEIEDAGYSWLVNYSIQAPFVEVYEKDGNETLAVFENISEYGEYKIYLSELQGSQDIFDLKVMSEGGVWFDLVIDPTLSFEGPTLSDNYETEDNWVQANVSVIEDSLDTFIWNWNGTNYTLFDDDLVLMMNFDNVSALGENSTFVKDISNYENDGVAYGDAIPTTEGKYNGAFEFNGEGDYVDVGDSFLPNENNSFALSAWVKVNEYSTGIAGIFGSHYDICLDLLSTDNFRFGVRDDSDPVSIESSTIYTNRWYLITGTYDSESKNISFYINGTLIDNVDVSSVHFQSEDWRISEGILGGNMDYFNGLIDNAMIWNRSLSEEEIQELYLSNLRKYDTDKWEFYINQTEDLTNKLSLGNYTYQAFAEDTFGNWNSTEERSVVIGTASNYCVGATTNFSCGDTVTESCTLNGNVTATGTCFTIGADNVVLDCDSYTINYSTSGGDSERGIYAQKRDNITIKNCNIIDGNLSAANSVNQYRYGIYFNGVNNSNISNNNVSVWGNSSYGIFLNKSSLNKVSSNTINTTGEGSRAIYLYDYSENNGINNNTIFTDLGLWNFGIQLEDYSNNNKIYFNNITTYGVRGYAIQLSKSQSNNISNNYLTTSGGWGLGMQLHKNSDNNSISKNQISASGYGLELWSNSNNNKIKSNNIESIHIGMQIYRGNDNNIIINNTIKGIGAIGLQLRKNNLNNTLSNLSIHTTGNGAIGLSIREESEFFNMTNSFINVSDESTADVFIWSEITSGNWNFVNVTDENGGSLNITRETGAEGNLSVYWYIETRANDSEGYLENAGVNITNVTGENVFSELTNSTGQVSRYEAPEYFANSTGKFYATPHTINVSYSGYSTNSTEYNLTETQNVLHEVVLVENVDPVVNITAPANDSTSDETLDVEVNASNSGNISLFNDYGLVSWWRMDDYNSTHVFDYMGRNNGTIRDNASYTSDGKMGGAFEFDGDGDYLDVENSTSGSLNITGNEITISAWIKTEHRVGTDYPFILSKRYSYGEGKEGYTLALSGAAGDKGIYWQVNTDESIKTLYGSTAVNDGQWHHIIGKYNGSFSSIFIDGNFKEGDELTGNILSQPYPVYIGIGRSSRGLSPGSYSWNGSIDDVMIWNRSLSEAEIQALYANQSSKYLNDSITMTPGTYDLTFYSQDDVGNVGSATASNIQINDTTAPAVAYETGTQIDGSVTENDYALVNISASDSSGNVSTFIDFDNSLVSWWRMDDYNETHVFDYMGRNNGTIRDNASYTSDGKMGGAFEFDGDGDYLDVGDDVDFDGKPANFTYSSWIYLEGDGGEPYLTVSNCILCKGTGSNRGFAFHVNTEDKLCFRTNGQENTNETNSITRNKWNYVVVSTNENNLTYYINGLKTYVAEEYDYGGDNNADIEIGRGNTVAHFNGSIDDVMIWNRSLSEAEIQALYANQSSKYLEKNFTSLSYGEHSFKAYAQDSDTNVNLTSLRTFNVMDSTTPFVGFADNTDNGTLSRDYAFVNVTSSDDSEHSVFLDWNRSLVGWWSFDSTNSTGVFDNSSYCYDNETKILTENGWKYFYELKNERVATLNQKTKELEWQTPLEKQEFDNEKEMYKILLEDGSEFLVSDLHKVYSSTNTSINSEVVNTGISDCSFKCLSLDQIGKFNLDANAKYTRSLSSDIFDLKFLISPEYSETSTNITFSLKELITELKSSPDFLDNSSLYLCNSSKAKSGANNLSENFETSWFVVVEGLDSANKTFASTTNFIYNNPSFFNRSEMPLFTFLPISSAQSLNPESSSCLSLANISLFQANSLALDSMQFLTNADQLISENCFISSLTFSGIDKVIDTICAPYVDKHKYVEVFKTLDFELKPIKEVYSEINSGEEVYFMDSENKAIKVKAINKEEYYGKIYDVDVKNDIVLVKRKNSSEIWSGNSNFGTFNGGLSEDNKSVGKRGHAMDFDGVDDYVGTINTIIDYNYTTLSWSTWVKSSGSPGKPIFYHGKDGNSVYMDFGIGTYGGATSSYHNNVNCRLRTNNTVTSTSSSDSGVKLNDSTWHQILCVYNGTDLLEYNDGLYISKSSITGTLNPTEEGGSDQLFYIGSSQFLNNFFNGSIDDVMIWNRALSEQEIKALYNAQADNYYNNFTSLDEEEYNFTAYAVDLGGNVNVTEERSVRVQSQMSDKRFEIKNSTGSVVAVIDDKGDMYIKGTSYFSQEILNPPTNSFILKNAGGTIIDYIDNSGNLYLKGTISENAIMSPSDSNLEIKNSTSNTVAYFDSEGNLNLQRNIGENYNEL